MLQVAVGLQAASTAILQGSQLQCLQTPLS
jgi:hypothetical protein